MRVLEDIKRPTKAEQRTAIESYSVLSSILSNLEENDTEIKFEETKERLELPYKALKLLGEIL